MKSIKKTITIITFISLAGCATHSTMRGSVAMKINENEAHVCLGNGEVKVGDKVNAFKNICTKELPQYRNNGFPPCRKESIGSGIVTSLLNEHYSVVKFDKGVDFNEGTIVEKQ